MAVCLCAPIPHLQAAEAPSAFAQRAKFKEAREKLQLGQTGAFRQLADELDTYILRPYLDYYYLNARVSSVSPERMLSFFEANPDLPVTPILRRRWLKQLGRQRKWSALSEHYVDTTDAELRCYHLRAQYAGGSREEALAATAELWTAPVSQPKACDPLFEVWRASSYFTKDVAWQRLGGAITANQRTLARYLARYFNGGDQAVAQSYYNVHVNPARISQTRNFRSDTNWHRQVIAHGITRLASRDAEAAATAWQAYQASHDFSPATRSYIQERVAVALAADGIFPAADQTGVVQTPDATLDMSLAAVRHQNWPETRRWIRQLPDELRAQSQWRYWLARAGRATGSGEEEVTTLYRALAGQRHYYGFLAARELGVPGQLNAAGENSNPVGRTRVSNEAGIARALELFAVGDDLNGRREWYRSLDRLSIDEQVQAGELAMSNGLVPLAIRTANLAEATDHLHLRFPLAHEPAFRQGGLASGLPVAFLFAIARQESALQSDARSTANARGLMQLLPSTARLVARRAKKSQPTSEGLYDPSTNIELGSYHLAWLLERFDQQTPLAIAAYNAGEHRVDRWIKDAHGMPMDVWIETIPFGETRNYVKNVLAFRHVYSQRLGAPAPMLGPGETRVVAP